jgi:hypothetical protein
MLRVAQWLVDVIKVPPGWYPLDAVQASLGSELDENALFAAVK